MKSILFLDVDNRVGSQIAEALARHFVGHQYEVFSAGARPSEKLHPMAVAVLGEIGIESSGQKPKSLTDLDLSKIDTAIILCDDKEFPTLPTHLKRQHWPTTNPAVANVAIPEDLLRKFRKTRDELRKRVLDLRASDQTW